VRFGICVPNLGEFTDPRQVAGRARHAEDAAGETVAAIEAAGATWRREGFRPGAGEYQAAVRRVEAGPPS
jgi:hypothetical protein